MLAAVCLVRNAADTIERALNSIQPHVDKVIVCLGGESTDGTETLLKARGVEVTQLVWRDNFAEARNELFAVARQGGVEWAILFDGDDEILEGAALRPLVEDAGVATCIMLPVHFSGLRYMQKRVFNLKEHGGAWRGRVHETYAGPVTSVTVQASLPIIQHVRGHTTEPNRNLQIMEKWYSEAPKEFGGHELHNYGNELAWHRRWEDAAKIYSEAIVHSVWDDEKYFDLVKRSECFIWLADYPLAWEQIVQAMMLKPKWKDAYLLASRWFYFRKMWSMCMMFDQYARSRQIPDTTLPVNLLNYTSIQATYTGFALARLGYVEAALKIVEEGLKHDPHNAMLTKNRAVYTKYLATRTGRADGHVGQGPSDDDKPAGQAANDKPA